MTTPPIPGHGRKPSSAGMTSRVRAASSPSKRRSQPPTASSPMTQMAAAPTIMITACTVSVTTTALSPPKMV